MRPNIQKLLGELGEFGRKNAGYYNIPADTGKFLHNLIIVSKAKSILEIGASNGYSAIWLAEAAKLNKGAVTTIEISESRARMAEENFKRARLSNIKLIQGDALREIPKLREKYDFMFIDAIKRDYIKYLKLNEDNLKINAVVVADNAIIFKDKMKHYLNYLQNNKRYSSVIVPIGTGMEFSIKIK